MKYETALWTLLFFVFPIYIALFYSALFSYRKGRVVSSVQQRGILQVYHAGPLCVAGFGGRDILDSFSVNDIRKELLELVKTNECETLAIDLTGVKLIPSGMLGLLASMKELDISLHLYNPSEDIREVLEITKLNQFMQLHDVEIPY